MNGPSKESSPSIASGRRQFLIDLAESTADDYCGGQPQVDPAGILDENDVTISYDDYGPFFDGMLHHEAGTFHVYCNEHRCGSRQEGRARFTLAHELAHFLIPEHNAALRSGVAPHHPSFCNKANAKLYVEVEADFFASRVLMPEVRFQEVSHRCGSGLGAMRRTANELGTSLQSTARRFVDSPTHPCAFVVWRDGKEPWFGVSAALRKYGFIFVKRRSSLAEGSATAVALGEPVRSVPEIRESVSLMSLWFSGVFDGSDRDVAVREEAMKTAYGTITWLSVNPASLARLKTLDQVS
ncbi:MAG: ImmA/IrrE family metallo-endopeptidase [Opitutaceae bacterium]|nr:ImmA/IrrE family metallo-endopeptidase [Opitutaceae bacterium]